MRTLCSRPFAVASLAIGALTLSALQTQGDDLGKHFTQTNLVSDIPGLATITDPQLVNPWGVSHSPTSPFWISNQRQNTATLYAVMGETTVTKRAPPGTDGNIVIPTTASGPQGPTGQVNNTSSSFPVAPGTPARFIFANLNGTISAWAGGQTAFCQINCPDGAAGTVYTGLAINRAQTRLYAANTSFGGRIDVFDSNFAALPLDPNAFRDPSLPPGLVPFNVQNIGGDIYVTYAPAGVDNMRQAALGQGVVAIFDEDGNFIRELVSGSRLAAPWGIAIAPPGFRRFSNDVLVGNFSFRHSEINAFIPSNGKLHGTIPIKTGGRGAGGLWALAFGVDGLNNGSPDVLYFTDGIDGEAHGLFGAIAAHREEAKENDEGGKED
jgi:uncharacterized protein (TIGR03118 family)